MPQLDQVTEHNAGTDSAMILCGAIITFDRCRRRLGAAAHRRDRSMEGPILDDSDGPHAVSANVGLLAPANGFAPGCPFIMPSIIFCIIIACAFCCTFAGPPWNSRATCTARRKVQRQDSSVSTRRKVQRQDATLSTRVQSCTPYRHSDRSLIRSEPDPGPARLMPHVICYCGAQDAQAPLLTYPSQVQGRTGCSSARG